MKAVRLMKRLKIISAAISFIGVVLIGTGIYLQYRYSSEGYTGNIGSAIYEFDVPRELVVITASLPITVKYGDTERVTVSYTGALPLIFSEKDGMLRVTQNDTFTLNLFAPSASAMRVDVTLPHKVYERISLSSSSGKVTADSLNAKSIEISTKNGDIELYGIDERTSIRTGGGKVEAYFSSFGSDMTINAGSGDVTLFFPENTLFNLEFYTESGSFTSQIFEKKYYKKYGDAAVLSAAAKHLLTVNTTKGDLIIN